MQADRGCRAGDPAAAVRLSQQLLALGADVTLRSRWTNMNALHYAAYFDVPDLVRVLLKGARPRGEGRVPGWEGRDQGQGGGLEAKGGCPGCGGRGGDVEGRRWEAERWGPTEAWLGGKGGPGSEETVGGWRQEVWEMGLRGPQPQDRAGPGREGRGREGGVGRRSTAEVACG